MWHSVRTDLESKLFAKLADEAIQHGQSGSYNIQTFQGHCTKDQEGGYLPLAGANAQILNRLPELIYS